MKKATLKVPNIYDFILNIFTAEDELRPAMNTAGFISGYVYATDAHSAIKIPSNLPKLLPDYKRNTKFPNAAIIFEKHDKCDETTTVEVQDILLGFFACKLTIGLVNKICASCDGEGDIDCPHCSNHGDCVDCEGSGIDSNIEPFGGITLSGSDIVFLTKKVSPYLLYKIAHSALLLGIQRLEVSYYKNRSEMIFKSADITFLLMAKYESRD